jgi:NAD(P)-dependent dehydrogenase (short-subunit alcohol dehydrogenase family)
VAQRQAWSEADIPDLGDRVAVVTGGNSGIGFEAARALAARGALVVLACRSQEKGSAAARAIAGRHPDARVEVLPLDLASLASIRAFAEELRRSHRALHFLVNNAGVMAIPYQRTADGFEMQIGTNHLGHFALTALLLDPLLAGGGREGDARVVTVSSTVHKMGTIRFDDLHSERGYRKWRAYAQSKLANLLFAGELARRLGESGAPVRSVACHPGYAATNLQAVGPTLEDSRLMAAIMRLGNRILAQDAAAGALPTLYAATASELAGADYVGPGGPAELWGPPRRLQPAARARDEETAARLWEISERETGVRAAALPR